MKYKEFTLRSDNSEGAATEIMYEVAASRADGLDLIRLNFSYTKDEKSKDEKKLFSSVLRLLKSMKQKGSIQFFATEESFKRSTTEAVFLQNKYPDIFSANIATAEGADFIYIKL